MLGAVLIPIGVAMALTLALTPYFRAVGLRRGHLDTPGVPGQIKAEKRYVPNTGGIAIFYAITLSISTVLYLASVRPGWLTEFVPSASSFIWGIRDQTWTTLIFLACLAALHMLGRFDDRRPLGPYLKLAVMLGVSALAVIGTGSRLFTFLDSHVGGPWLSILITILWIGVVTNAMNFLDNMDGLSAGVTVIAGGCFLWATLAALNPQWFVAGCLALLIGACLGFLVFNFPRQTHGGATVFMGDSGSLLLGFCLAFLTVRTTFYDPLSAGGWYAVLMPLVVLAVPLYDFASVCVIRLRAGRSPFVGDLNHLSHRLVRRGLSRRDAVIVIYGLTGITAMSGIGLSSLEPWKAPLVGAQVLLVLVVMALFEGRAVEPTANPAPPRERTDG
jgi:UDP-GlcNAc:undecaprenyl-phosphate GlcNAc-1-phosphate transferase